MKQLNERERDLVQEAIVQIADMFMQASAAGAHSHYEERGTAFVKGAGEIMRIFTPDDNAAINKTRNVVAKRFAEISQGGRHRP